jgi:tyrosine-specific transport protein
MYITPMHHKQDRPGKILKGALLVAGTCMGGGMLALPVQMSQGGFIPSLFI